MWCWVSLRQAAPRLHSSTQPTVNVVLHKGNGRTEIPEVGELDELETFVVSKKNKIWIWTAVNHFTQGVLAWVIGDHSASTFEPLWEIVKKWKSYFYVTDG